MTEQEPLFLAALDPDTVCALIARVREAEAKLAQVGAWRNDPVNRITGRIGALDAILDGAEQPPHGKGRK